MSMKDINPLQMLFSIWKQLVLEAPYSIDNIYIILYSSAITNSNILSIWQRQGLQSV